MAFSEISRDAFDEMRGCVRDIEFTLKKLFEYDKINYLMLMMVDPHVHYHVIPRYEQAPVFKDMTCQDTGWPGQPDLGHDLNLSEEHMDALQDLLIKSWP